MRAEEPESGEFATCVRTELAADVQIRRLVTSTRGAGAIAQAWVWARDLEEDEIMELWVATKDRYLDRRTPVEVREAATLDAPSKAADLPWDTPDPIIDKDNAAMLEIPLASKLAFQVISP